MTREKFLLLKLIEECAEVAQRASKQIQFGAQETQGKGSPSKDPSPDTQLTNAQRLLGEIIDFAVIVDLLYDAKQIPDSSEVDFDQAKETKIAKLNKYLAYSRQLGEIGGDWTV